ncbi:MAG: NAD-dependent epimerase/dehydratase family protein [bacterium]|nr:NAD-dependent epimerase/dehydratase family protein [bacterium]
MKILITGGGGFQGSHLAEFLVKEGHTISVLNTYSENSKKNLSSIINKINLIWGSVTDKEIVDKSVRGHEVVFHLAGHGNVDESMKDPRGFIEANVLGTYNIFEACRKYNSRLILTSTSEVYGDGHDEKMDGLINETAELKPNNPYASSKAAADRIAYSYFRSFDLDVTIVRPFNIFGERQKSGLFGALIPIIVDRALRGQELIIFGDGTAERDYCHIDDAVRAYYLVLNNSNLKGKSINFASGKSTQVREIVEYVARKFDAKIVNGPARHGEVMRIPADISFAKSLGYIPKISIWEGIDRYIEWAKKQPKD